MIHTIVYGLTLAASSPSGASEPMQACQLKTQAWCLVQGATHFDVFTVSDRTRVWILRDAILGGEKVRIIEDRACGSYPSDMQEKTELMETRRASEQQKYIITWKLHKSGSCSLRFELPVINNKPNEIAYYLVGSVFVACTRYQCPAVSLAATPQRDRLKR